MIRKFLAILLLSLTISLPVYAQFTFPVSHFASSGVTGQESLDTIEPSCVQDVDATIADSYFQGTLDSGVAVDKGGGEVGLPFTGHNFISGQLVTIAGTTNYNDNYTLASVTANEIVITETFVTEDDLDGSETVQSQEWLNLVSSGTVYDLMKGGDGTADTTDPNFGGTVGGDTGRFDMDGGDFFTYLTPDPEKVKAMHMTSGTDSGPTWFGLAFRLGDVTTAQVLFISGSFTPESIRIFFVNSTTIRVSVVRGSSLTDNDFTVSTMDASTDYLMWISFDPLDAGGTDDIIFFLNEDTGTTDTDANTATSSTKASAQAHWGAQAIASSPMVSGGIIYGIYFGVGTFLTDTIVTAMNAHIKLRHEAGRY